MSLVYLFKKHTGHNSFVEKTNMVILSPADRVVVQDPEVFVTVQPTKAGETTTPEPPTTEEPTTIVPNNILPDNKPIVNDGAQDSQKQRRKQKKVVIVLV